MKQQNSRTVLIIGLGNPGKKYEKTRHNMGFMAIDNLQLTIDNCSSWKLDKKSNALVSACQMSNVTGQMLKIVLAKPQTFMNNSGQAVGALTKSYKLKATSLVVIHDDIDLPLQTIRVRLDGSSGGHKGVQSVINALQRKDFVRVRVGIAPEGKRPAAETFVLKKITKEEWKIFEKALEQTSELLKEALEYGVVEKTVRVD